MRSARARAIRFLIRLATTLDTELRLQIGLPLPADRGNPYPIELSHARRALALLAEGTAVEEVVAAIEAEEL